MLKITALCVIVLATCAMASMLKENFECLKDATDIALMNGLEIPKSIKQSIETKSETTREVLAADCGRFAADVRSHLGMHYCPKEFDFYDDYSDNLVTTVDAYELASEAAGPEGLGDEDLLRRYPQVYKMIKGLQICSAILNEQWALD